MTELLCSSTAIPVYSDRVSCEFWQSCVTGQTCEVFIVDAGILPTPWLAFPWDWDRWVWHMKLKIVVLPLKAKRPENRLNVVPLWRKRCTLLWEEFVWLYYWGRITKWECCLFTASVIYQHWLTQRYCCCCWVTSNHLDGLGSSEATS